MLWFSCCRLSFFLRGGGARGDGRRFHRPFSLSPSPNKTKTNTALVARGPNWRSSLASWSCPSGISSFDPCGNDFWGLWPGVGCRGGGVSSQDKAGGGGDGRVTNLHFTKSGGEGPDLPVEEFCALGGSIKEFDLTVGDAGSAAKPSPPVSTLPAAMATW